MLRMVLTLALLLAVPCSAQVLNSEESLQEQLTPDSFKLEASAAAIFRVYVWQTVVTYSIANNSGMNLYLGLMQNGVTIGNCSQAEEARGTLPFLPPPNAIFSPTGGPRSAFVPAGGRAAGTIVFGECGAPNPGSPTAPLSLSLMIFKTSDARRATTFPISATIQIRQLRPN